MNDNKGSQEPHAYSKNTNVIISLYGLSQITVLVLWNLRAEQKKDD